MSKYGVFSGPYFPVVGQNSVEIQENTDRKNSVFGHFSRSEAILLDTYFEDYTVPILFQKYLT